MLIARPTLAMLRSRRLCGLLKRAETSASEKNLESVECQRRSTLVRPLKTCDCRRARIMLGVVLPSDRPILKRNRRTQRRFPQRLSPDSLSLKSNLNHLFLAFSSGDRPTMWEAMFSVSHDDSERLTIWHL